LEQQVERGEIHGCTSHGLSIWKGRCIFILDIKGDSFTVESLKKRVPGVVNKHELANLFTVNTVLGLNQRRINLMSEEMDEESVYIELAMMGCSFGLPRDPTAVLEVVPLTHISLRRAQMPF
jgi:hypothetical protein